MKKVISLFISIFILASSGLAAKSNQKQADEEILRTEPCEFKPIEFFDGQGKSIISKEELESDIENLCYILSVGYAGYDDMKARGFDVDSFSKSVHAEFDEKDEITSREFFKSLHKNLQPYINDAHFQLINFGQQESLCQKKIVLWTDIFIEEKHGSLIVQESGETRVKSGAKYEGSKENLFFYPSRGSSIYRLGILTSQDIKAAAFTFSTNGKKEEISVPLKNDGAIEINGMKYKDFETERTAYVTLNSFMIPPKDSTMRPGAEKAFEKYAKCGKKYNQKDTVILDLRQNGGGDPSIAMLFLYCLWANYEPKNVSILAERLANWQNEEFFSTESVYPPVALQASFHLAKLIDEKTWIAELGPKLNRMKEKPVREIRLQKAKEGKLFSKKPKFTGKLVILTDRNCVSAGELTIILAKHIFGKANVTVIGENTYGMASYWDLVTLKLPASGIGVHTAFKKPRIFNSWEQWQGEGSGIMPDWWALGSDLNQTIYLITGDDEMKARLENIDKRLM